MTDAVVPAPLFELRFRLDQEIRWRPEAGIGAWIDGGWSPTGMVLNLDGSVRQMGYDEAARLDDAADEFSGSK